MKRLMTFLMALLGVTLFAPPASAQGSKTAIGARVQPDDFVDSMEVVFECRSGIGSAGHYFNSDVEVPNWTDKTFAQTIEDHNNIPEKFKFILIKSGVKNSVTGLDQWFIKSKETGKYLTFNWTTWNGEISGAYIAGYNTNDTFWGEPTTYWAEDTTSAKSFCIVSNSDDTWRGQYGSSGYGSASSDWNLDTYTVVYIHDAATEGMTNKSNDGGGWGRVFLANEFPVSNCNIRFYAQYQDTNVWDIREVIDPHDPLSLLAAYADQLPDDIADRYLEGTDPGFVGDHEAFTEFFDAYTAAIDGSVTTDEGATAALARLQNAYAAIQAAVVQVKDGGYYYIKTAYDAFTTAENGEYAWMSPYTTQYEGWKAFKENDNRFIWKVKFLPDPDDDSRMYYTFQNVGTGTYLGTAESHGNSQPVVFTNDSTVRITLIDNGAGQWGISSKYDYWDVYPPRPYHMEGHNSGAGTEGRLVLWAGERNSASSWYIREVPADQVAGIDDPARKAIDNLANSVVKYSTVNVSGAVVGTGIGQPRSQETVDNFTEALRVASAFANGDSTGTADEFAAANTALVAAGDAFSSEVDAVPDGYYRIHGLYKPYYKNANDIYFALYNDTLPGWKHYQKTSEQLWKITNVEGGFTIQNVKNGMYINKAVAASNGSLVDMTKEPETTQLISNTVPDGTMSIYNTEDASFGYDPAYHNNGLGEQGRLQLWSPRSSSEGTWWELQPVSEADAQALIASEADNELNIKLQAAYEQGRAMYNSKTDYTIGEPIITSADQIYVNNWSPNEGTDVGAMIDNNKDTYWNSTWESGQEQDPNNPHYIRVYDEAGFPDTVQVQWVMRQNSTWHREPIRMRVQVSNDADSWTTLYDIKRADVDGNGSVNLAALHTDSIHYIVTGLKDYKYVRFLTQVNLHSTGGTYLANNKMMIEYAEYNLFPVTGVEASSYTQQATHKGVAADLYAALQEAAPQYANGNATQATLDKLTAAIEAFSSLASGDSLMQMVQYNYANLTAGDRIGEFPKTALDAYKSTVETVGLPILNKINSGDAIGGSEYTNAVASLTEAYKTLYASMVKPERNVWYMILSGNGEDGTAISAGGPATHRTSQDSYSYFLYNYKNEVDASENTGVSFTINEDENGRFVPQVVRSGGYFGPYTGSGDSKYDYHPIIWYTPKSFEIVPFGDGQIGFVTPEGYYVKQNGGVVMDYTQDMNGYADFQNSGYAWTLKRTDEAHSDLTWAMYTGVAEHRVIALTVPYEIQNPAKWGDEDLPAYEIVGKSTAENSSDSIVTAYWLKRIDAATVGAGKPAIYITPGDVYNEESTENIYFTPVLNTELQAEVDTVNGLRSTNCAWNTTENHLGYFLKDSVVDEATGVLIGRQRGVIIPYLVENTVSSIDDADAVVYVQGAGMINGIENSKVIAIKQFVNVYTIDGVLLRKHVDSATATDGLKKGVYIVGSKKVLVK